MKLLSCHIENFGKLHDYSVDFSDGANILCEENGWGKSTFAAFVRAMFYGLEGERKRSIGENERKRYRPWQGGIFGGQLVFEAQGGKYQISRIFGDKEANDEFELRDAATNLPSKDYTGRIGEELFRINRESFMRTAFIEQGGCETAATDDINAKIGNLADNANDLNSYDAAAARLTEILNALTPSRATGSLSKRRDEITGYERLVRDGQGIADSIHTYQEYLHREEAERAALKAQLQEAGKEQTRISKIQSVLVERSEWERLKKEAAEKKKEAEGSRAKLPGDVPELEEIRREILACGDMDKARERVSLNRLTERETEELAALQTVFEDGVLEDADLDAKIRDAAKCRELEQEIRDRRITPDEQERLEELERAFRDEPESVSAVAARWNERNNRKAALPSKQAALTALRASLEAQRRQKKKVLPILLLVIGLALAVLGVAAASVFSPSAGIVGIPVAGVGGVLAAAAAASVLLGRRKAGARDSELPPEVGDLQRTIDEDSAYIARVDAGTEAYLAKHGRIFEEHAASAVLQEIMAESVEYHSLRQRAGRQADSARVAAYEALKGDLAAFLAGYGTAPSEERFADELYTLKSKALRFRTLEEKKENLTKAEAEYRRYAHEIKSFLEKCGCEAGPDVYAQLCDIRDWSAAYLEAAKAQEKADAQLRRFESTHDIAALSAAAQDEDLPSLEEINDRILRLTEKADAVGNTIAGYQKTLADLQEACDEWEENRLRLEELRQLQAAEQKKYDAVRLAKNKLTQAKEAMTAKYAAPLLQAFGRYYEMISGEAADAWHMDANTAVTVDELGKQRSVDTLSSGCRDLTGICLRLALIDAMYQAEPPVLIMDDPFTNLDDGKIRAAKRFLEAIAARYQVIYFTCSQARAGRIDG